MNERLLELKEQLTGQIKATSAWQQASQWYLALAQRDRLIVKAVAAVLVVAMIFLLIYAPLLKARKNAASALQKNVGLYNQLAENAYRFGSTDTQAAGGSLLTVVTRQAKAAGLSLSRYEQDGKGLRVWLDNVSFDDAITMLESLQSKSGVVASQINIDKTDRSGVVDIRATLSQ